jgi:hypothetical protein
MSEEQPKKQPAQQTSKGRNIKRKLYKRAKRLEQAQANEQQNKESTNE